MTHGERWYETDLARAVVAYLRDYHWTVYQEVQFHAYSKVADIVAVQGPIVWIVECKLTFGLNVLDQAWWWTQAAHYVSVATPAGRRKSRHIDPIVMEALGVGSLEVHRPWRGDPPESTVEEIYHPRLNRTARTKHTRGLLRPEHQTFAEAGNAESRRFSAFQATCLNLAEHVEQHPGCLFQDAIDCISHHYATPASAKSSLRKWLCCGSVRGVRMERDGRCLRLYPALLAETKAGA